MRKCILMSFMKVIMIQINNFSLKYDSQYLFENLNINFNKGKITCILGKSGCGKSSLIKHILNRDEAVSFSKKIDVIGYMPQNDLLLSHLNVESNLKLALKISKSVTDYQFSSSELDIIQMCQVGHLLNKQISELSGGEKSRISFTRAYLSCNDLLICDEPFSKLDYITRYQILNWFNEYRNKLTVIFVTHDVDEAMFISDQIMIVKDRDIIELTKPYSKEVILDLLI